MEESVSLVCFSVASTKDSLERKVCRGMGFHF
jgi:hypothetical protein